MRSFIASVVLIAGLLIGQQWAAKANDIRFDHAATPAAVAALDAWMSGAR